MARTLIMLTGRTHGRTGARPKGEPRRTTAIALRGPRAAATFRETDEAQKSGGRVSKGPRAGPGRRPSSLASRAPQGDGKESVVTARLCDLSATTIYIRFRPRGFRPKRQHLMKLSPCRFGTLDYSIFVIVSERS